MIGLINYSELLKCKFEFMRYYYIYLIRFCDGRFYIGKRTSKVEPHNDTKYMGSPITFKYLWEDNSLTKTKHILKLCKTEKEMIDLEVKMIKTGWKKFPDLILNRNAAPAFHEEACVRGGKKSKELKLGIHKMTREELSFFGRIAGNKSKELGVGIHGMSKEERLSASRKGSIVTAEKYSKDFILKSPEGKIVKSRNIKQFARNNNLDPCHVRKVLSGKYRHHKGWTLP